MRYTRYDYKKKNNDVLNLTIVLVSVLVIAFILGTGIYSMLPKPDSNSANALKAGETKQNDPTATNVKFVMIQSGFFKTKGSAEELKNNLKNQVNPFTIVEGDSIRVMAGIFNEDENDKVIQLLNQNGLPNMKTIFEINKSDFCDAEIAEMISGNLKILTKLMEKDVAGYSTDNFKNWMAASIKDVDKKSKNYNLFQEYKNYINGFPQDLGKDKVEENYTFIYNALKKLTGK
jgi:hypothetical protein